MHDHEVSFIDLTRDTLSGLNTAVCLGAVSVSRGIFEINGIPWGINFISCRFSRAIACAIEVFHPIANTQYGVRPKVSPIARGSRPRSALRIPTPPLQRSTYRTPGCAPLKRRRHSPARSTRHLCPEFTWLLAATRPQRRASHRRGACRVLEGGARVGRNVANSNARQTHVWSKM